MKSGICETCGKRLKMVKYPVHVTDGEMFKVVQGFSGCY
jgi:hypothetical protein